MERKIELKIADYNPNNGLMAGLEMNFLNGGNITIPAKKGAYIVASGCGSGKTTIIKELIRCQYRLGILYSAATIRECNEMYQYCKTILPEEDIVMFHSSYQDEGVDNNLLRNNSNELTKKKVIICTHHKLLHESPEILFKYRLDIDLSRYSPQRAATIGSINTRQLILIDELPTCKGIETYVRYDDLRLLGFVKTHMESDIDPLTNEKITFEVPDDPMVYKSSSVFKIFLDMYYKSSGFKGMESSKLNNESDKLRLKLILGKIFDNYSEFTNRFNEICNSNKEIKLTYNLSDFVFDTMDTRFILFDGTGDLTFRYGNNKFRNFNVLTFDDKYNSNIELTKIKFGVDRSYKTNKQFLNKFDSIIENLNTSIDTIDNIIKEKSSKVLVVTWKNFKVKDEDIDEETLNPISEGYSKGFSLTEYIKSELNKRGNIERINYSIIHYQSGLDKATNEFRDYDSIVFLGEFHVPEYVIDEFNLNNRTVTTSEEYQRYQLVQAVCRTRIRNHKGESVNIYFTDDWKDEVMVKLVNYLTNKPLESTIKYSDKSLSFIKPKWRGIANLFCDLNPEIRRCLENKEYMRIDFTLDDIYELIPMSEKKKVEKYYPMINYFRKFNLDIHIESNAKYFGR